MSSHHKTTARFFNHTRTAYINGADQSVQKLHDHSSFLSTISRCYYKHDFSVINHIRTTNAHNNLSAQSDQPHCCFLSRYLYLFSRTAYINGADQSVQKLHDHSSFLSSLSRCYYKHDFSVTNHDPRICTYFTVLAKPKQ